MGEDRNGGDAVEAKDGGGPPPALSGDGRGLGSVLYKVGLAGVGALILAQEEIEAAWRRARGEKGEEAPTEAEDAGKAGQADGGAAASRRPDGTRVSAQIDGAIGRVLRSLSIPTRDEVDAVAARIEALSAQLDARDDRRK